MPQPVTRRAVVRGVSGGLVGAGSLLATGCSLDPGTSSGATPGTSRARSRGELSSDELTVVDLVARLTTAVDLLTRTTRTYPLLAAPLAGVLAAERTHLATLGRSARAADLPQAAARSASPSVRADTPTPGDRGTALAAARTSTGSLRAAYLAAAAVADSGSFARLLASMGCSLTQRLPEMRL